MSLLLCVLQPATAPPQQAWAPNHWRQHTRRKRQQHQFRCPTRAALEHQQQQERLLKCQRWVCAQEEAPAHSSEQPGLELELEAASAGDTGAATDGNQVCSTPQPCSSDTASNCSSLDGAGTGGGSTCSRGEAATSRGSRDGISTSSRSSPAAVQDAAPGAAAQAEPALQPCQKQQLQQVQGALPVQPAAAACSAAGGAESAADVDDVSVQKAAAQARFAQQQRMEAVSSSKAPSVLFDADLLQQEQARLLQPGYQTRMFACALLSNLLCCLVLLAAKVRGLESGLASGMHDKWLALVRGWP